MSSPVQKESIVFKNSLLPAEAQFGLVAEIQDKLKRAIEEEFPGKPLLYLAVSNFSYQGPDVMNAPFDFSVEKPAEVEAGIDLIGPLPEALAGAVAFGFQEVFILAHQRFREGDRDQLLHLAHLGDGGHHLYTQICVFSHLTREAWSADRAKSVIEIASNSALITYTKQIREAKECLNNLSDGGNVLMILREKGTLKTATEHLEGVSCGRALLMEALKYPWLDVGKDSLIKLLE